MKLDERFENIFEDILNVWYRPFLEATLDAKDLIVFTKGPRSSGSGKLKNNTFLVLKDSTASKE